MVGRIGGSWPGKLRLHNAILEQAAEAVSALMVPFIFILKILPIYIHEFHCLTHFAAINAKIKSKYLCTKLLLSTGHISELGRMPLVIAPIAI